MLLIELSNLLKSQGKTVAVAESCTGGLISNILTNISGSSKYFILGVVAYSNAAKISLLKIPKPTILKYGAVSKQTALAMAKNVRKLGKADFGMGVTGIAGPAGGSKEKPVGTVFIAIDSQDCKICQRFQFSGNRLSIKRKSVEACLKLLKQCLKK